MMILVGEPMKPAWGFTAAERDLCGQDAATCAQEKGLALQVVIQPGLWSQHR